MIRHCHDEEEHLAGEPCREIVEPMVVKKASADDEDEKEPEAPEPSNTGRMKSERMTRGLKHWEQTRG